MDEHKPYSDRRFHDNPKPRRVDLMCYHCVHYHWGSLCDAFPDGMPDEILSKKLTHDHPIEGDHGIQFELKG